MPQLCKVYYYCHQYQMDSKDNEDEAEKCSFISCFLKINDILNEFCWITFS